METRKSRMIVSNLPIVALIAKNEYERVEAMKWWNKLSFDNKKFYAGDRNPANLTGREIHIIYSNRKD